MPKREINRYITELIDIIAKLRYDASLNSYKIEEESNINLSDFLIKLEYILEKDLKPSKVIFGNHLSFWSYFLDSLLSYKPMQDGIFNVLKNNKQASDISKGRAFIRYALVNHQLADTLQFCSGQRQYVTKWYKPSWPLYQTYDAAALVDALYTLNEVNFVLKNFSEYNAYPQCNSNDKPLQSDINITGINGQQFEATPKNWSSEPRPIFPHLNANITNTFSNILFGNNSPSSSSLNSSSPKWPQQRQRYDGIDTTPMVIRNRGSIVGQSGVERAEDVAASITTMSDCGQQKDDGLTPFQRFYAGRRSLERDKSLEFPSEPIASRDGIEIHFEGSQHPTPLRDSSHSSFGKESRINFSTLSVAVQTENESPLPLDERQLRRRELLTSEARGIGYHLEYALSKVKSSDQNWPPAILQPLINYMEALLLRSQRVANLSADQQFGLNEGMLEITQIDACDEENELFDTLLATLQPLADDRGNDVICDVTRSSEMTSSPITSRPSSAYSHLDDIRADVTGTEDEGWKSLRDELEEDRNGSADVADDDQDSSSFNIEGIHDRLKYQERHVSKMERELVELKCMRHKDGNSFLSELQVLTEYLNDTEVECQALRKRNEELTARLEQECQASSNLQVKLNESRAGAYGKSAKYKAELATANKDNRDLKEALLKFIKEKDALWRFSHELEQKVASAAEYSNTSTSLGSTLHESTPSLVSHYASYFNPTSLYDSLVGPSSAKDIHSQKSNDVGDDVIRCHTCKSPFWLLLQRHKCQVCRLSFCHYCARNWVSEGEIKDPKMPLVVDGGGGTLQKSTSSALSEPSSSKVLRRLCDACYKSNFISPHPHLSLCSLPRGKKTFRGRSLQSLPCSEISSSSSISLINNMALSHRSADGNVLSDLVDPIDEGDRDLTLTGTVRPKYFMLGDN